MALSFKSVEKAYEVFGQIKREFLPDLQIPTWPQDMGEWKQSKKENPKEMVVYGWGKKYDDGWESIQFFMKDPSQELKDKFQEICRVVPNTHLCEPYHENKELWVIGWF